METTRKHIALRRAVTYGAFLAAIWAAAAVLRPATTYHLAPLLIAATLPVAVRFDNPDVRLRTVGTMAALGAVLALLVTALLVVADWLRGPSLLPFGGAVAESVVFAFVGAVGGFALSLLGARRTITG